jgi:hypothetical protein
VNASEVIRRAGKLVPLAGVCVVAAGATHASSAAGARQASFAAGATVASFAAAATLSTNWAGYLVAPHASVGSRFSGVSGSWRAPSATCSAGRETYSATWVGLGGAAQSPRGLEQIGTAADCTRSGHAAYSAWYELIPAGPVELRLRVHPGDEMSASVTARANDVTLRIRDLSTGARFTTTKHLSALDASTAEWIVEAPSVCAAPNVCTELALTNFGTVAFSSATATAAKHTGTIEDSHWSATAVELRQDPGDRFGGVPARRSTPTSAVIGATPSSPPGLRGSFSVTWHERSLPSKTSPAPTLPTFNGGPP